MSKEEKKELPIIKHLIDKIGDNDIVSSRKVTMVSGETTIKSTISHNDKIVGILHKDNSITWFDIPEAEEAKKLI